ncbi:MAG: signal peptidase II [Myxococcota bacterium]
MTISRKLQFFLPVFVISLVIDQVTKRWIIGRFGYGEELVVIPGFFNLTHVRNPGGAFSFLATMPETVRQVFFLGTGALAIVLLLVFLRRLDPGEWLAATAIGSVLGGAIGNLADRLLYGEVIDFLDFRLIGGYIWPTFNMADCWIVGGVTVLMIEMFLEPDVDAVAEDATDAAGAGGQKTSSSEEASY